MKPVLNLKEKRCGTCEFMKFRPPYKLESDRVLYESARDAGLCKNSAFSGLRWVKPCHTACGGYKRMKVF